MSKIPRGFAMSPSKQVLIFLVILSGIGIIYWKSVFEHLSTTLCTSSDLVTLAELRILYDDLRSARDQNKPLRTQTILLLTEYIGKKLNQQVQLAQAPSTNEKDAATNEKFACPEKYRGTHYGYMFFFKGWETQNCTHVPPISKIVTVLLYPDEKECPKNFTKLVSDIRKAYFDVTIIWAGNEISNCTYEDDDRVRKIILNNNPTDAFVWNSLVRSAKTPTVFIGRDVSEFIGSFSSLNRLLWVLSSDQRIFAAGGAVRNKTGHWRVGCYQSERKNYMLRYQEGYYMSQNECMFCDHIDSPFVARTNSLKKISFNEKMKGTLLFEDLFLRVQRSGFLSVSCPDILFMTNGKATKKWEDSSKSWLDLTKKFALNRIILPDERIFSYSCKESGMVCTGVSEKTKSFLMPICCIEQVTKAILFLDAFANRHGIRYEFEAGSALGIVKAGGLIPWDLDADATFLKADLPVFRQFASEFSKAGLSLTAFDTKRSYFKIQTPDMYIEMWGEKNLSSDAFMPEIFRNMRTKVRWNGNWVYGPVNPGAYARNRYGYEILKHTQSWIQLGLRDSWQQYESGYFLKCAIPGHHACLDQFSADGNIQFMIPRRHNCEP